MVLPIFLSRALRSAVAELLLRVVFAGIGLYLLDILTDAITAYRYFTYHGDGCEGGHPIFGSIVLTLMFVPGFLVATRSVLEGTMSMMGPELSEGPDIQQQQQQQQQEEGKTQQQVLPRLHHHHRHGQASRLQLEHQVPSRHQRQPAQRLKHQQTSRLHQICVQQEAKRLHQENQRLREIRLIYGEWEWERMEPYYLQHAVPPVQSEGGNEKKKKKWWNLVLLAPMYYLIMLVWWPFVPVISYFYYGRHLIRESRGLAAYDDSYRRRAVQARELEGLGEAGPQFAFQIVLLWQRVGGARGLEPFFPQVLGPTAYLLYLQLASSLISFVRVLTESQTAQVRRIGRIREAPTSYYVYYFAWSLWSVFSKVFVAAYSFAFTTESERWGTLILTLQVVLLSSLVPLNIWCHWRAFGRHPTTILDGILSTLAPVNFVHARRGRTIRFLANYSICQHGVFMAVTYLVYGVLANQVHRFVLLVLSYHGLFSVSLILLVVYCQYGLDTLYSTEHLCYPHMRDFFSRRSAFPADVDMFNSVCQREDVEGGSVANVDVDAPATFDDLSLRGHFYSDRRGRRLVTTCYACGRVRRAEGGRGEANFHEDGCPVVGKEVEERAGSEVSTADGSSAGSKNYSYLVGGLYERWLGIRP